MANNNHFNLTLDTIAPTGSITRPGEYINKNGNLAIAYAGEPVYMKVWFNDTANGTKSDEGYLNGQWEAVSPTKLTDFKTDGVYYYHLVLMDSVNNESTVYNTAFIGFDTTSPTVSNFAMEDPDTGSTTILKTKTGVKYSFNVSESGAGSSGLARFVITGNDIDTIDAPITGGTSYSGAFDFKSGTEDGQKTVQIVVYDVAGNASTPVTATIKLDTQLGTPVLALETTSGDSLPEYINYREIKTHLTVEDDDIVGYKIWEGDADAEPTDWTAHTPTAGTDFDLVQLFTISAGNGLKTINAKVKDEAGNEKSAAAATVTLDTTDPVVTLTSNVSIISNVSGYNTATLTLGGSDSPAGVKSYILKCGDTTISSGTTIPATFALTSAESMVEGDNTITLIVEDNAGNTNSATVTIKLDTTKPTVSIGTLNAWYTAKPAITITYSDNVGVTKIYAWTNTTATDTVVPSGVSELEPSGSPQTISSSSITGSPVQSENNYMHVKVVDSVGNVEYAHAKFGYDSVVPVTPTVTFTQDAYTSTSATINITSSDATSGLASMRVAGDISNPTTADGWEEYASTRSVTLVTPDGLKHVTVIVKDVAGNISAISAQAECELDTSKPTGSIALFEPDGTATKANVSPVDEFVAHVSASDDNLGGYKYKIYGDFNTTSGSSQGITEALAEWVDYTPDSGKTYVSLSGLYCTAGNGKKTIYIKVMDNAGNINDGTLKAEFTYDTTAPTVVVSDVDYNIISKVNELRRSTATTTIAGKYSDECNFVFTPNEYIKAYKVCAYVDQAAAEAGSAADAPIPTAAGSANMAATGLNQNTAVNCKIKGADFEVAIGGASSDSGQYDGAHIVVVYVQDMGGTWSVAAEFTTNN